MSAPAVPAVAPGVRKSYRAARRRRVRLAKKLDKARPFRNEPVSTAVGGMGRKMKAAQDNKMLTLEDAQYIEVVTNPFAEGHRSVKELIASIPNSDDEVYLPITVTTVSSVPGTTTLSGWICAIPFATSGGAIVDVVYGNDDSSAAAQPSAAYGPMNAKESVLASSIMYGRKVVLVGAGLRVTCSTSVDTSSGTLQPSESAYYGRTATATFANTYGDIGVANESGRSYPVKDGICVRARVHPRKNGELASLIQTGYAVGEGIFTMPRVHFYGLSATTVLRIECVQHYAVQVPENACPFHIFDPVDSEDYGRLVKLCADYATFPWFESGHSFKSFATKLGLSVSSVAKTAWKNRSVLIPLARTAMSLAV